MQENITSIEEDAAKDTVVAEKEDPALIEARLTKTISNRILFIKAAWQGVYAGLYGMKAK